MLASLKNGMLLALQFFTVLPIRREVRMERSDITAMYMALPAVGIGLGGIVALALFGMKEFTDISSLLTAFVIVLGAVVLTGGLHLDGLADAGDAFFSYRDREKRFAIMEDPRIGAFGVMVLLFFVVGKIILVAEIVEAVPLAAVIAIPFAARIVLLILFASVKSAKTTGLVAYFQQHANRGKLVAATVVYTIIGAIILVLTTQWLLAIAVFAAMALFVVLYGNWCKKHFGGMTGDLFGAGVEGAELVLWIVLLLLI